MTAAAGDFAHVGLFYTEPEELVAAVLPVLREAIDAGDALHTIVDRRTDRALRDALADAGYDPDALVSRSPAEVMRAGSDGHVRALRALAGQGGRSGRVTMLGQYQSFADADDVLFWEAACSLVTDDLPVTLVCACSRDGDPRSAEAVIEGHPHLLVGEGPRANPRYRRPPDRSPSPASLWGRRSLRLRFGGPGDLARIRERVARVLGELGLGVDDRDAAVLAVHEAALLAVRDTDDDGLDDGDGSSGPCLLEVRTDGRAMLTEVHGPGASDALALRYVEMFCSASALRDDPAGRAVRVLTSPGRGGAAVPAAPPVT